MPLGRKVGLGPGRIVLDGGSSSPSPKRGTVPQFLVHVWPNGRPSQLLLSTRPTFLNVYNVSIII